MTALVVALAIIGALTVASMVGLAVWCWLFENDGEKAARQLGGWR